jgi:tetratricopeptide (TPR) repeat protein
MNTVPGGLAVMAAALLVACANPINQKTYQRYMAAGQQAAARGDLATAKINYSRAVQNAWVGHLSPQETGNALFNYARILGNLCEHDEAEKWFVEANRLNEEVNGSGSEKTYVTVAEVAQLNYDIGRYEKAVPYFEKALSIAEKYKLETRYPSSFADVYADYADALAKTGNSERANSTLRKANELKATGTKPEPGYTRYPKSCS